MLRKPLFKILACVIAILLMLSAIPTSFAFAVGEIFGGNAEDAEVVGDVIDRSSNKELVSAGNFVLTYSDFEYDIRDGKVIITEYVGSEEHVAIPDTIEGYPVIGIGNHAFDGCNSLVSITIPDSVTSISHAAFQYCDNLEGVYITDMAAWCSIHFDDYYANPLMCAGYLYLNGELVQNLVIPDNVQSISAEAFSGCTSLESVTIHDGVTDIGCNAFEFCSNLTDITLPNSIDAINSETFYGCKNLAGISIPDGVSYIGTNAFYECSNLKKITISDSVTYIGEKAFYGCSGLEEVYISDIAAWCNIEFVPDRQNEYKPLHSARFYSNPLTFAEYLYVNDELVTKVVIPEGVTDIPPLAFSCDNIVQITIPNTVSNIGDHAFRSCNNLNSVTIPDSVTNIEAFAFYYCKNLNSITIPDSVTHIGESAFGYCSGLSKVYMGSGVTEVGSGAFHDCKGVTGVYISDLVAWCSTCFKDPEANPLSYTDSLYVDDKLAEGIIIPEGVEEIGDYVFYDYDALTSLNISDTVVKIGTKAFISCSELKILTIPKSVKEIGNRAFGACKNLREVVIEGYDVELGEEAFVQCESVTVLEFTGSVKSIGKDAFKEWYSLQGLSIPDLEMWLNISFDNYASNPILYTRSFYVGNQLTTDIVCPDGTVSIGDYAFFGFDAITSVVIPASVKSIGDSAFAECGGVENIYITDISAWCNIDFGDDKSNPIRLESDLYLNGSIIQDLIIPQGVETINNYAFSYSTSIQSVTVPDSVTSVGENSFANCNNLKTITIPDSVTSIGTLAFSGCTSLESITIPDSVKLIGEGAFDNTKYYLDDTNWEQGILYIDTALIDVSEDVLGTISIKDGTTILASGSFIGCSVEGIEIPPSLKYVNSFLCDSLNSVYITDLAAWCAIERWYNPLDNLYINGEPSVNVVIPEGVTIIQPGVFSCKSIKSIVVPQGVKYIGENVFHGCENLETIYFPESIEKLGYGWIQSGISLKTVYYEGTEEQWKNVDVGLNHYGEYSLYGVDIICTKVVDTTEATEPTEYTETTTDEPEPIPNVLCDADTDISVETDLDADLVVYRLEEGSFADTGISLPEGESVSKYYDISLEKDGNKVEFEGMVKVRIPAENKNSKVYRVEDDDTLTDMQAVYVDGYLEFYTEHFSLYIVTESSYVTGDVNCDGKLNIKDATAIQKYIAMMISFDDLQLGLADYNGDTRINVKDATTIQKKIAGLI